MLHSIIAGGAGLIGGLVQSRAIRRASETSAAASRYASDLQQNQYNQSREDLAPWRESGVNSLKELNNLMYGEDRGAALRKRPGYQFRLDEGLRALSRRAAAGSTTGRTYRSLVDYGQNAASAEYGNEFNRLSNMAGTGQAVTQFGAQLGANAAGLQGQYAQRVGDTRASAYMGQGQVFVNTLAGLASAGTSAYQNYSAGVSPSTGNFAAGGYGDNWTDY